MVTQKSVAFIFLAFKGQILQTHTQFLPETAAFFYLVIQHIFNSNSHHLT